MKIELMVRNWPANDPNYLLTHDRCATRAGVTTAQLATWRRYRLSRWPLVQIHTARGSRSSASTHMSVGVRSTDICDGDLPVPVGKSSCMFAVFAHVEAKWFSLWCKGIVTNLNRDGNYDIHFLRRRHTLG